MKVNLTIPIPVWLDRVFSWPVLVYRKLKYGYTFRRISLGEGEWTIVDQEDYYRFNIFNWCPKREDCNDYVIRLAGETKKKVRIISLHREIMGNPANRLIDHKNHNGFDNRQANLRIATKSQNTCNRRKMKNTSSRFIGVCFCKRNGKWEVNIKHQRKGKWIGYFEDEVEAAKAYDKAARKYHGEFANLNFPEDKAA